MEWLEILAYREHQKGALLKPDIEDFSSDLIAIAHSSGVKFTLVPLGIRVLGYVRKSESPVFVERISLGVDAKARPLISAGKT